MRKKRLTTVNFFCAKKICHCKVLCPTALIETTLEVYPKIIFNKKVSLGIIIDSLHPNFFTLNLT